MEAVEKLTNMQLELLKLFQYKLPDNQLVEIKKLLADYFAEAATNEMDNMWNQNQWNSQTMNELANEHLRTK